MKIRLNSDKVKVSQITEALIQNDRYCPCSIEKTEDTKCMCKEFRERDYPGFCHCGLYEKVEE